MTTIPIPVDLRCVTQARQLALDPVGTAAPAAGFLLVELPLPWPKDAGTHPALATVSALAQRHQMRLQAIVPDLGRAARGEALVVVHGGAGPRFTAYERRAAVVPIAQLDAAVDELVASSDLAPAPAAERSAIDVLLCAHGTRDRCCGSLGTALHARSMGRPDVHLWRTSHLGGHRFAPTALVLPSGTCWAWLDDDLLDAIVDRSVAPSDLRAHYRGSAAMPHPSLQVVEAELFARIGWGWVDHWRRGEVRHDTGDRWEVTVESELGTWRGVVEKTGTTPQPVCGDPLTMAAKHDDQLRLVELEALSPA